jgi:hypothetical protein
MQTKVKSGEISFFSLLGIVFIVLKLCHVIDWSWWLVLLPFYGGLALVLVIFIFGIIISLIGTAIAVWLSRR